MKDKNKKKVIVTGIAAALITISVSGVVIFQDKTRDDRSEKRTEIREVGSEDSSEIQELFGGTKKGKSDQKAESKTESKVKKVDTSKEQSTEGKSKTTDKKNPKGPSGKTTEQTSTGQAGTTRQPGTTEAPTRKPGSTGTTAQPGMTEAPSSPTKKPDYTRQPGTTSQPSTTEAPAPTKAPSTTSQPTTTRQPATTEAPTEHKHDYKAVKTYTQKVLVKDAWTEEVKEKVPKYVDVQKSKCSYCGKDLTGDPNAYDHTEHCGEYYYDDVMGEYIYTGTSIIDYYETVQDGYEYEIDYVEHPAEYKNKTVTVYKCSCGAIYEE